MSETTETTTPAKVKSILDGAARYGLTIEEKPTTTASAPEIRVWEIRNDRRGHRDVVWVYWSPGSSAAGRISTTVYSPATLKAKKVTRSAARFAIAGMAETDAAGKPSEWDATRTYVPAAPAVQQRDEPAGDEPATLDYAGIAALTGLTAATLRRYRTIELLPEPDASPTPDRPRWREATIRRWMAERPGRGKPRAEATPEPVAPVVVEPEPTDFAKGYQAAMGDVARAWIEGGSEAAARWVRENLLDRTAASDFAAALYFDGSTLAEPAADPEPEPAEDAPALRTVRADEVREGDELYREANDSTGRVVEVEFRAGGLVYINAGHFDREVPAGERVQIVPAPDRPFRTIEMAATFGLVRDAKEFVDRYLADGKSSASEVEQRGRVVRWKATTRNEQYVWDLTENAGAVGTYGRHVAYVNGIRAPRCY